MRLGRLRLEATGEADEGGWRLTWFAVCREGRADHSLSHTHHVMVSDPPLGGRERVVFLAGLEHLAASGETTIGPGEGRRAGRSAPRVESEQSARRDALLCEEALRGRLEGERLEWLKGLAVA